MKNLLLLPFMMLFFFTGCTVDDNELLLPEEESDALYLLSQTQEDCIYSAGADNSTTYSHDYIKREIEDIGQIEELYLALLDEDVDADGSFEPTIEEIYHTYKENPLGDFTTIYTIGGEECTDSAELTITITEGAEVCVVSAGSDASETYSQSYIDSQVSDLGQIRELYLSLLEEGVDQSGSFSPDISEIYDQYKEDPIGDFTTTYTVQEGECSDSTELTLTIICDIDAGTDQTATYTQSYIESEVKDLGEITALYLELLDEGVDQSGTFNPTIEEIHQLYKEDPIGDFTTTYTVGEGECQDSVQLTITVVETDNSCDLNAGSDNSAVYTKSYLDAEISDIGEIEELYLDLLDEGVDRSGTFNPDIEEIYRQYKEDPIGEFSTVYTISEGEDCRDSTELTIEVVEE